MSLKIAVIGAGAWGTALAISASREGTGHAVQLWTRDPAAAKELQAHRSNERYLPGVMFPAALQCVSTPVSELAAWAQRHDLIVVGTPMSALRGMLHGSRYASKWLTLLVMIYFTEGVVRSVTERELSQWLAMAETAMASALFVTAIVHVRSTRKALPAA